MNKDFNIENLDRKTPYTVPETFFDQSFRNIMDATVNKSQRSKRKKSRMAAMVISIASVAAVMATAFFTLQREMPDETSTINETAVSAHVDKMMEDISDEELSGWAEYTDPDMYLASY